ncbi:fumarylacetoacetate hydrolase family protein [Paucibacter soli]|uniref:fumarylacetoacetate hydrolase family protein n=1 Tax=Paucibacter soli TaxID=3133433 RepID=UPI0030B592E6
MKLATYRDGSRDGQLVVVSRDLAQAHYATGIATRLQQVLDDWNFIAPQLQELSQTLNHGKARHAFSFDPKQCMAPLPRAYAYLQGAAYARQGSATALSQAASDGLLGPCEAARFASESLGIDFGAGLAVLTGDVAMGSTAEAALESVRLLMLCNDWALRSLPSGHLQPSAAFAPVAVTLDEAGEAWQRGRLHLGLQVMWNGRKVGLCEAGPEMGAHFGELIAQLAKTRKVQAGSIIGSGTVSNREAGRGYASIAEKRALELAESGEAKTEFMKFGDSLRIEVKGRDGLSLFGAIDQDVASLHEPQEDITA